MHLMVDILSIELMPPPVLTNIDKNITTPAKIKNQKDSAFINGEAISQHQFVMELRY